MVAGEQSEQQSGEQAAVDDEFVDNTLQLDDIPQIELPFRDDISKDFKDLLRALVINQQNIINNASFLYNRIKDLSSVLQRVASDLEARAPSDPRQPENPPRLEPVQEA